MRVEFANAPFAEHRHLQEDQDRRELDREWRDQLKSSINEVYEKLQRHIDREEKSLDNVLEAIQEMKRELPQGHKEQHDAMREWVEERQWLKNIRRDAVKNGLLWTLGVLAIWALSRIFPELERLFR